MLNQRKMDMNEFLYDGFTEHVRNRKFHEALSDLSEYIHKKQNEFENFHAKPSVLFTGSSSEGLGILGNDSDIMYEFLYRKLKFENTNEPDFLFIDTKNCTPGFCHVVIKKINLLYYEFNTYFDETFTMEDVDYLRRDNFVLSILTDQPIIKDGIQTGPAITLDNADYVPSFKCSGWPEECNTYFNRVRHWPEQIKLDEIYNKGMHIVGTASTDISPAAIIEFRLSFSLAEKILIRDLSMIQFITYYFLKRLKDWLKIQNGSEDYIIKSYFIKTIVLWSCERVPKESWTKANFLFNAKQCLSELCSCFKKKSLPHLFLNNCNLLASYSDSQIKEGMKDLENMLVLWENNIESIFFLDDFIKLQRLATVRPLTRKMEAEIKENSILDFKTLYRIDRFALCIEAKSLSYFTFDMGPDFSANSAVLFKSIEEAINSISEIVHDKFASLCKVLLTRVMCIQTVFYCRGRSKMKFCIKKLTEANHTIRYPVSGFIDSLSSKVWLAYFFYLAKANGKAQETINSIENLDSTSPIGYSYITLTNVERNLLQHDVFLKNLIDKANCTSKDGTEGFDANCLLLAHYLRSKLLPDNVPLEILRKYSDSIEKVMIDFCKVWIGVRDEKMELINEMVNQIQLTYLERAPYFILLPLNSFQELEAE